MPPPGPFDGWYVYHGGRRVFQSEAYITCELLGSMTTSTAPTLFRNRTFVHVLPPSLERNTPRSGFALYRFPMAATNTTFAFFGSTAILPMCCVSSSPTCDQVLPPSV